MKRDRKFWTFFSLSVFMWIFSSPMFILGMNAQDVVPAACENCFTSEIISIEKEGECITISLQINAEEDCRYALSHFMVAIPCGTVSNATNSGKWPMELMITDPTTGIKGLKVDNIQGFGENGKSGSFILTYTVCSSDVECISSLENEAINVGYKASTCVFYEEIQPEIVAMPLSGSIEAFPVGCFGSNTGSVITTVSGGVQPYTYLWNNGASTQNIENVGVGNYLVSVVDAAGSEIELSAIVSGTAKMNIAGQLTQAYCTQSNGAIDITVSGGAGGYTYFWAHGPVTEDLSGLASGSYQVAVTDAQGCIAKMPFFVSSQSPIKATTYANTLECHENGIGKINLDVWGGTAPYNFAWSNGATSQNIEGLNVGSYRVTITDAEGCKLERSVSVARKVFYVAASVTPADCSSQGGSAILNPQNGTGPYVAEWSNGDTGMQVDGLAVGSYMVLVTDANGCKINQQVTITGSGSVSLSANITSTGCGAEDDAMVVDLMATGGTGPYTFYVNGIASDQTFQTNVEGNYSIEVVDSKGCSTSQIIAVNRQVATFSVSASLVGPNCENPEIANATISISNGKAPYTILWNGVEGDLIKEDLTPGDYLVNVVDANGCNASTSFEVKAITKPTVEILTPENLPVCISNSNLVDARVTKATSYYWLLNADDQNWIVTAESINQVVYNAGTGTATLVLVAKSADGCEALDYLELNCSISGDDGNDDGGDNDDGDGDGDGDFDNPESCLDDCIQIQKSEVSNLGNGCVKYELTFATDGSCRYELSHLVIDLGGAYAMNVSNSRNWKMELNSTDPKSGLSGIKIDDINGFGKRNGDSFTVTFELCNATSFNPNKMVVAYKAGQCLDIETVAPSMLLKDSKIKLVVYPNPSATDTYFELTSSADTYGELMLYNQSGIAVSKLFEGTVAGGVTYKIKYSGGKGEDMIMFYKLESGAQVLEGKILRLK